MGGFRFGADFAVDGDRCEAWLYTPVEAADAEPPVIVMAPGLAMERRWRLPAFARRFAEAGVAALLFDYRGFGDSEGTARVVDAERHVADYRAALERARDLDRTGDRVALWGTGFGAGHALTVAAEVPVDALAVQTPFLDGRAQARRRFGQAGTRWAAWATLAALRDRFRAATWRSPHYVPVAGEPGDRAVLTSPGAKAGYERSVPDDAEWPNRCSARVLAQVPFYRPLAEADAVDCPVLVVQAEDDDVVTAPPIDDLVATVDDVERVRMELDHFDVYTSAFRRVVDREAAFLAQHLLERSERRAERQRLSQ
jgi:alpha-beta hydrolase superfamily lysophospholipase